MNWLSSYN